MQTVPKTAEEAAQLYLDGGHREAREFIKHHGRTLARKLIVAIWERDWDGDREKKTILFFLSYASSKPQHKVRELIKAMS